MINIRRSEERGKAHHGWLKSYHSFSFADYYDPKFMGFKSLRVINEDVVAPNQGFGTHPHNNMEILTYIISGELEHKDSMGNGRIIRAGELQAMSAGSGVRHSEFNPSSTTPVHFLQIWITPNKQNLTPSYAEWKPSAISTDNSTEKGTSEKLTLLASPDDQNNSVQIYQDAFLYLGKLLKEEVLDFKIAEHRASWLQIIEGEVLVNDLRLLPGDAVWTVDETQLPIKCIEESKFLLFDLS